MFLDTIKNALLFKVTAYVTPSYKQYEACALCVLNVRLMAGLHTVLSKGLIMTRSPQNSKISW